MVEESPNPSPNGPRVVKKVVKRTVVRPAPPSTGRPAAGTATKPRATAVSRVSPAPTAPSAKKAAPRARPPRPSIDLGARIGALGTRGAGALRASGSAVRRGGGTLRHAAGTRVDAVRAWRIPTVSAPRAALIAGLVVGLLLTTLGWLATVLFSTVRGTSAGGGLWGGLAVLVIVAVAFTLGSALLSALGSPQPRLTETLALMLVALAVMLAFLELAAGVWAWLIVPVVSVLAHLAANQVLALADVEGSRAE